MKSRLIRLLAVGLFALTLWGAAPFPVPATPCMPMPECLPHPQV
ncbi:hypothetical protein HNR42_002034 [Deinobacterium chartae]|uniref:Uncharacterized protein n=1 Tax=Deinobacterium chartae TaxID=521158 RepID=A0A841I2G1_9DEIO|nr:hypothetical protein [Deinobacterium chartae]MBB6098600.1 hypothetical protein [Deinobacterium chartae]